MKQISSRRIARLALPVILAISLLLVLTAATSADSARAVWSGVGQVVYVGPSQVPGAPTTAESKFKLRRNGTVRSVVIHTENEQFAAVLGGGPGGGAFTKCKARKGSTACEELNSLLTGSVLVSLHSSTARLTRITQGEIQVPIQTPGGPVVLDVPVLSGQLRGKLEGQFTLSNAAGGATGSSKLKIRKGSTGTYACFGETPFGPVPLESLDPCIHDASGQLFPIVLDVKDSGKFELGPGSGSMEDILGIEGKIMVHAQSNLLLQQFGGKVEISKAKTELAGKDEEDDDDEGDDDDKDEKKRRRDHDNDDDDDD